MNRILSLTVSGMLLCSAAAHAQQVQPYSALHWKIIDAKDVLWQKRVWRDIDANDKQNADFRYNTANANGANLLDILLKGCSDGSIRAYADERFTQELGKEELAKITGPQTVVERSVNPVSGEIEATNASTLFAPEMIYKYRVREDWIFDRAVGKVVVRITAIAPLQTVVTEEGKTELRPLCWIYYPAAAESLAAARDNAGIPWLDVFEKRTFGSTIIKITDPHSLAQHNAPTPGSETK